MATESELTECGLIPVVVLEDEEVAEDLATALVDGGINVAEVTFRTPAALAGIERMAREGGIIVGAGTVLTPEQVDGAVDAGAQFIVSPGLRPAVVERAQDRNVPVIPGAVTPSEIMTALSMGVSTLKFFPANIYGGPKALTALGAPFGNVKFVPTGGVNPENLAEYSALPNVAAVGGTWMVKAQLLRDRAFETITETSRQAVNLVAAARKDKK